MRCARCEAHVKLRGNKHSIQIRDRIARTVLEVSQANPCDVPTVIAVARVGEPTAPALRLHRSLVIMLMDELADLRIDDRAPAPSREDPVVTALLRGEMPV